MHRSRRVEELGGGEEAVRRTGMMRRPGDVKIPGFDLTDSWEAFAMQLTIMSELNGWTDSEKTSQLTAALRAPFPHLLPLSSLFLPYQVPVLPGLSIRQPWLLGAQGHQHNQGPDTGAVCAD
ncbi:hypothetical protein EOD39_1790 [Acipenser ruthenus]|uniref:Uncharacterized protein n=1 Tax=Acipenser ruthenus TaxID=7906 RepID=A0A444U7J3_ACIRT|nr:hypothetical protein EOD39_1790 [Acipenser ruthenus]